MNEWQPFPLDEHAYDEFQVIEAELGETVTLRKGSTIRLKVSSLAFGNIHMRPEGDVWIRIKLV